MAITSHTLARIQVVFENILLRKVLQTKWEKKMQIYNTAKGEIFSQHILTSATKLIISNTRMELAHHSSATLISANSNFMIFFVTWPDKFTASNNNKWKKMIDHSLSDHWLSLISHEKNNNRRKNIYELKVACATIINYVFEFAIAEPHSTLYGSWNRKQ